MMVLEEKQTQEKKRMEATRKHIRYLDRRPNNTLSSQSFSVRGKRKKVKLNNLVTIVSHFGPSNTINEGKAWLRFSYRGHVSTDIHDIYICMHEYGWHAYSTHIYMTYAWLHGYHILSLIIVDAYCIDVTTLRRTYISENTRGMRPAPNPFDFDALRKRFPAIYIKVIDNY